MTQGTSRPPLPSRSEGTQEPHDLSPRSWGFSRFRSRFVAVVQGSQGIKLLFCSFSAAMAPYLAGVMRQHSPAGMPRPAQDPTAEWPSGSAVFVCTPSGGRMEAGRVVPDGAQWRVWLRHGTGYRDRGTAPQRSAAVMALLDAATRPKQGARMAALMRRTSLSTVPRAGRPWRSRTRG